MPCSPHAGFIQSLELFERGNSQSQQASQSCRVCLTSCFVDVYSSRYSSTRVEYTVTTASYIHLSSIPKRSKMWNHVAHSTATMVRTNILSKLYLKLQAKEWDWWSQGKAHRHYCTHQHQREGSSQKQPSDHYELRHRLRLEAISIVNCILGFHHGVTHASFATFPVP